MGETWKKVCFVNRDKISRLLLFWCARFFFGLMGGSSDDPEVSSGCQTQPNTQRGEALPAHWECRQALLK